MGTEGLSGSDVAVVVKDVLFQPVRRTQDATHFKPTKKADGTDGWIACAPSDPQAVEHSLQQFADENLADQVVIPPISMSDFEIVLLRARPTVSHDDLAVFEQKKMPGSFTRCLAKALHESFDFAGVPVRLMFSLGRGGR